MTPFPTSYPVSGDLATYAALAEMGGGHKGKRLTDLADDDLVRLSEWIGNLDQPSREMRLLDSAIDALRILSPDVVLVEDVMRAARARPAA